MTEDIFVLEFEKPIVELEKKIAALKAFSSEESDGTKDVSGELSILEKKCEKLKTEIYSSLTPWQRVQLARHPKRPYTLDYINLVFSDFVELHGDRAFADDRALICGLAFLDNTPVVVIGQQKGRNVKENMERNFAMVHPEGYRKALRIMKLAEKFNHPVITFIDTPGAYPGIDAEERGQAEAIAKNLREMAGLKVPIISVVIGEGGSGGALGIGVANRVLMLENAYYSVISPEGCAAILFRDATKAAQAAEALKITAQDLHKIKVIDDIVEEPIGGAHKDVQLTARNIKEKLKKYLSELMGYPVNKLLDDRYAKYRNMGMFVEPESEIKKESKKQKVKIKK